VILSQKGNSFPFRELSVKRATRRSGDADVGHVALRERHNVEVTVIFESRTVIDAPVVREQS